MTTAFDSIERGLREALAYARGESPATIHEIEVPRPEVEATRSANARPAFAGKTP